MSRIYVEQDGSISLDMKAPGLPSQANNRHVDAIRLCDTNESLTLSTDDPAVVRISAVLAQHAFEGARPHLSLAVVGV